MADDADIIPGPYILQYGYHFGVVIIKLIFGPSFFFCPCGFRQTNVAACGQCGTLSGYYFFLNGRGCFADLYSSLIQGDGGGIAGIAFTSNTVPSTCVCILSAETMKGRWASLVTSKRASPVRFTVRLP